MKSCLLRVGLGVLISLLLVAAIVHRRRPPLHDTRIELFDGVTYVRERRTAPRPLLVHVVTIDLERSGARPFVTPGDDSRGRDARAQTVAGFIDRYDVDLAINGSYFYPFEAGNLLGGGYPQIGDPVTVDGQAISDGRQYSPPDRFRPVLCAYEERLAIERQACADGALQAVAGNRVLVRDGRISVERDDDRLHPRTAVAIDRDGNRLWLIVVDGRQPLYSEGVTLVELAELALALGADVALNLDGGGSSTLAVRGNRAIDILNAPIDRRVPMRQRPVANHLGFYFAGER